MHWASCIALLTKHSLNTCIF